jgi:RNA-binding motif X-linked protein 2
MNSIRRIQELNKRELEAGVTPSGSWHRDHSHSAFIYIGGLQPTLSEGDVLCIFSQFGEPTYINLVRDRETGKSKGFCFLKYEDQRSTDLAVDNLSGAEVLGRMLNVDHTTYKVKEGEILRDNTYGDEEEQVVKQVEDEEDEVRPRRPMLQEEKELQDLMAKMDEDDPMREYLIQQKKEEVKEAIERYAAGQHGEVKRKHRHRSRRDGDEEKRHHRHRPREGREGTSVRTRTNKGRESDDEADGMRRRRSYSSESQQGARRSHRSRRTRSRSP